MANSNTTIAYLSTPNPQIIFNVISPKDGKAMLILLFFMNIALGAVVMETLNHLRYDFQLARKPGWLQPAKFASRIAYFLCRILSPLVLVMFVLWASLKHVDCHATASAMYSLALVLFSMVTLIFMQRTMALYSWRKSIVFPLSIWYVLFVVVGFGTVPRWGIGFTIPGTDFCGQDPRKGVHRVQVWNILYKCIGMGLDLTLLLLMLHRLLDGGIASLWRGRPSGSLNGQGISMVLIRQGFHFYVLQVCSDIFLITVFFTLDGSYGALGLACAFSIPPIAATAAFRGLGVNSSNNGKHTEVNEIMSSDGSPSGAVPTTVGQTTVHAGRTTRVMWGSKINPFHRSNLVDASNIKVTVGTVSRTDHNGIADWPQHQDDDDVVDDLEDKDDIEMQRQVPKLTLDDRSITGTSRTSFEEGSASIEKVGLDDAASHR
ncbi:hypothetical protein PSEUBRA_003443 [Kalmanozyma brasiliensis GHG001]|uniref:Uncharacterized protein n=1 Tax=Kalmanozyma brasiliensis (strain GHG001) TaxID=1365824 RepID=V5EXM7_KALBG|nr:uncharacterized protein PSEUBRA_003443 [Kalmanozyma brasiliensis GHG001]EST07264.1 hypothetical protein PSEUBRA_003443 [Kalmanozyma brasiliensis GHG001]